MCHTKRMKEELHDYCPICGEEMVKGCCLECEADKLDEEQEKQQIINELFNSEL